MTEEPTGAEAAATAALANGGDGTQGPGNGQGSLDNGTGGQPAAAEWDSLPQSWQQDLAPYWKDIPENVRKYAFTREKQMSDGFKAYGMTQKQWDKAIEHFKPYLAEQPDMDVADILQTLAYNHINLLQIKDPVKKKEVFRALAAQYDVDLTEAQAAAAAAPGAGGAKSTNVDEMGLTKTQQAQLKEVLGPLFQTVQQLAGNHQQQITQAVQQDVDKFFSDPQNKFANAVAPEILQVLKDTGGKVKLAEAYHLAMLRKPEVYAQFMADKAAGGKGGTPAVPGLPNLKSSGGAAPPATPATMKDSMDSVLVKAFPGFKGLPADF